MLKNIFIFLLAFAPLCVADISPTPQTRSSSIQPLDAQNSNSDENSSPSNLESTTKDYESAFIKMIVFLVVLLILVFAIFFIFKKLSSSRMHHNNHYKSIKILEKRAISPKSMLYMVEVGGKKILLAESQFEIRNISNLEWVETEKKGI
jgi:flagellar biogenesis protein FliO